MSEEKKPKRRNKYLKYINKIQVAATTTNLLNGVSKELEYQQAFSVLLRSRQLAREGKTHSNYISPEEKTRQINKCYEQRTKRG